MPDKTIKLRKCKYCKGRIFRVFNDWEWRLFSFHCAITCKHCYSTAHGVGITPQRAYKNAMKEWKRINAR